MNSNTTIHISQATSQFFNPDVRLSHKQQLECENRSERRLLQVIGRRLTAQQRAELRFKRSVRAQSWRRVEKFLIALTPLQRRIMDEFLKFGQTFDTITVSAFTIAQRVGCCRDTVQELLKKLRQHGLLVLNRRRYNKSSARRLHPDLFSVNLKMRLWTMFDAYRHYFEKANRYLKLFLLFQKEPTLEQRVINPSITTKDDIQLYERVDTHSRELSITVQEESHLLPSRKSDITSRELTQVDIHSRSGSAFEDKVNVNATPDREVPVDPQELSQKIAEFKKTLEPQRAAQRALKADAARELSELLKGRVTATLHLSAKGQFYMARYCDGALLYGLESLAHHGTIDTLINFRLFESACIEYSRKNEIEVDAIHYDNLLQQLGYLESQALCKKILLESPLAKRHVAQPEPKRVEPAAHYQSRRRVIKPPENSGQVAVDHFLQDSFKALGDKLGYSELVSNLPQISTGTIDND